MISEPAAVFFDAGNTLLRAHPGVSELYVEVAGRHGIRREVPAIRTRFKEGWQRRAGMHERPAQRGGLTSEGVKSWWGGFVAEVFELSSADARYGGFFEELYERFAHPSTWQTFDDVVPCLEALGGRGLRLGVLSNWDSRLPGILEGHGLLGYFDPVVISAVEGWEKPHPRIFEIAVQRLGVDPASVVHVGDNPVDDYAGASKAGLRGVLLDRDGSFPGFEGRRIRTLLELCEG